MKQIEATFQQWKTDIDKDAVLLMKTLKHANKKSDFSTSDVVQQIYVAQRNYMHCVFIYTFRKNNYFYDICKIDTDLQEILHLMADIKVNNMADNLKLIKPYEEIDLNKTSFSENDIIKAYDIIITNINALNEKYIKIITYYNTTNDISASKLYQHYIQNCRKQIETMFVNTTKKLHLICDIYHQNIIDFNNILKEYHKI